MVFFCQAGLFIDRCAKSMLFARIPKVLQNLCPFRGCFFLSSGFLLHFPMNLQGFGSGFFLSSLLYIALPAPAQSMLYIVLITTGWKAVWSVIPQGPIRPAALSPPRSEGPRVLYRNRTNFASTLRGYFCGTRHQDKSTSGT